MTLLFYSFMTSHYQDTDYEYVAGINTSEKFDTERQLAGDHKHVDNVGGI